MCLTRILVVISLALASDACSRQGARLQQHREKFESLGATTKAIGEAWLAGSVSGTYTSTALERTFLLVEQERQALAEQPAALADPRGADLARSADGLSRAIAAMQQSVSAADAASVRNDLAHLPIVPRTSP